MTITKTEDGFMTSYTITGLDDEGKECNLENWEYRCSSEEEAKHEATKFLESRGIDEEITME